VPVRTLTLAWQMADRREANDVTFIVESERGVLRVDGVEMPFDAGLDGYPDIEEYLSRRGSVVGTAVTLAAEDLFAAIHGANLRPPWLDGDDQQSFVLSVDAGAGRLRAVATWDGHADTSAVVACTATGDARLGVNPGFLYELASAAGEDILTLHLPPDPGVPLRVETDDGFLALLMPVRIGVESNRPAFEALLAELLEVEVDDLDRDGDGDYPVPIGDATELNDLNRHVRFARLYWADGSVFVGAELVLASLDAAELGHACRTVNALADRVGPLLEAVHGAA
jgi:hypothetical protein